MFTTHRLTLLSVLSLCTLASAQAAYHNAGTMQSKSTSLFCTEVINTGTMIAEEMDATGLETFTNSGSLDLQKATIGHNAEFRFKNVDTIEIESSHGSWRLHHTNDEACSAHFLNPHEQSLLTRILYTPETRKLSLSFGQPGDQVDLFIPSRCHVEVNAPATTVSLVGGFHAASYVHVDDPTQRTSFVDQQPLTEATGYVPTNSENSPYQGPSVTSKKPADQAQSSAPRRNKRRRRRKSSSASSSAAHRNNAVSDHQPKSGPSKVLIAGLTTVALVVVALTVYYMKKKSRTRREMSEASTSYQCPADHSHDPLDSPYPADPGGVRYVQCQFSRYP